MGLEFLDVTSQASISLVDRDNDGTRLQDVYRITNSSTSIIDTHLIVIARGLAPEVKLLNASGKTSSGDPYLRVFLPSGVLVPGQSITARLNFQRRPNGPPVLFTMSLLSGQGTP